ncbi:helix-turn-helix domain-containing protein [Jannaschia rubra]|uniref:Replication initiation protein RepC n=2 Tax=Jannaschia rubra TaxID=282197 RepID=A0A0M6XV73_9RHOB|nr:helix-turn-helix domain-containing protein [Jannaschia rubra]CTQ34632.1 replication initiation protein RepC [Jannaschia rubra]SFG71496.1 replication initiation protein RepC [Jannaschia rubra]
MRPFDIMHEYSSRGSTRRAAPSRAPKPAPELRWQILDDLTAARDDWGLKDRTLQVLRALLSFLPRGETTGFVVFPSNRTLSERLLGMPESTLRRHLAVLRDAGLIARRDSPNRKRFRVGRNADLTFGLDLTPLFAAAHHLRQAARQAADRRARVAQLRARIRDRMARADLSDTRRDTLRGTLRRKLDEAALTDLLATLPPETDVADSENGRHTQTSSRLQTTADDLTVAQDALEEVAGMVNRPLHTPRDVERAGELAALALGVRDAFAVARHRNGAIWATMALAHVHRRLPRLRDPDRYLHALVARAATGGFDLMASLSRPAPPLTFAPHP